MLIAIIIGTIVLLAVAAFFLFVIISYRIKKNKYIIDKEKMQRDFDKALLESVTEVQETTFKIVGEELHDNVGQLLSSTKMLLGITERNMGTVPETLHEANGSLSKAISELRSISKVLNKEWLKQFSFIDNLNTEFKRLKYSGTLNLNIDPDLVVPINSEQQIILFRIVQEALNNIIKHADAKAISVTLTSKNNLFSVVISDDGIGFDPKSKMNGVGLINMKQRAGLIKGTLLIQSSEKGSTVTIKLSQTNGAKN
ncbi:hypothetical protein BH09BAC2_BH09BAC2_07990 [soil metagenome]